MRYKFGRTFPGDRSGKSGVESKDFGYLPLYQKISGLRIDTRKNPLPRCDLPTGS